MDDEEGLRLIHPDCIKDGRVLSAAFKTRSPVSIFIRERLPGQDGDCLHIDRFAGWGRARLRVADIRATSYIAEGMRVNAGFDLRMTPHEATHPFEAFADAHATLEGPTHRGGPAKALAEQFMTFGVVERLPA